MMGRQGGRGLCSAVLALCVIFALSGAGPPPAVKVSPPTVVLISMDGVRWDYPGKYHLPSFEAIAKEGCSARRLTPPFPSLTFPSHATLATGVNPSHHGIVANSFLDRVLDLRFSDEPEASWLKAPPLWVLCERAGMRAAVGGWCNSRGPWEGTSPAYFRPYEGGDHDRDTARWILDLLKRPASERPRLIMAWMRGADGPGHGTHRRAAVGVAGQPQGPRPHDESGSDRG